MMGADPSVSVVITTYNHGRLVLDAIASVLAQSIRPLEIIVVNDGSTDGTHDRIVTSFGGEVRCISQPNGGVAAARNRGVVEAGGTLIALMDGDDLWHERKLEFQVAAFLEHPASGIIAVRRVIFDSTGTVPNTRVPVPDNPRVTSGFQLQELLQDNFLATTSEVAIPKHVLDAIGPSDSRYPLCSDFDLYCRIASAHPITVVHAPLTYWRYHPTSASGPSEERQLRWGPEMVAIVKRAAETADRGIRPMFESALERKILELGWAAYRYGTRVDRRKAVNVLLLLLSGHLHKVKLWLYLAAVLAPLPHRFWRAIGRGTNSAVHQIGGTPV